jgi:hypothetical protein
MNSIKKPTFPQFSVGRRSLLKTLGLLGLAGSLLVAQAQTSWTTAGAGDFNTAANWNNGVPNTSLSAYITNGTAGTPTFVNVNGSGSVLNLTIGANSTLNVAPGSVFTVAGTSISNAGTFNVTGGSGTNSYLSLNNSVTLSGPGALVLSYGDHNGNATLQQAVAGVTLTNASTIRGDGLIGNGSLTVVNAATGVINADVSGQTLTLNPSGEITNAGLLTATNNGTLQISTNVANAGGTVSANSGTVNVSGTITGGTLSSAGTGVLQTAGAATLNSLTISNGSTYTGSFGTGTTLVGTINNNGSIVVNGGSGSNTNLSISGPVTLQGGGNVTLNSTDNNGQASLTQSVGGSTLTNVDNRIQGYGTIGSGGIAVTNQSAGVINANSTGNTLLLNGSGNVVNTGLLEATNGGTLRITNVVANNGGHITADGGTVGLASGTVVQGGTLTAKNGGTLGTVINNAASLDGATAGAITLSAGTTYTAASGSTTTVSGTLNNQGAVQVNGGSGYNTYLSFGADTTLQGGGTVTLDNSDNNGRPYLGQSVSGVTLTNTNNTIRGAGTIGNGGLTFINGSAGVVNANVSQQTLVLNGSGNVTNAGLLEATNGGILQINNVVANGGAAITADNGTVQLFGGAVIQGGTLNTRNGGTLGTIASNSATLDGTTLGAITLSSGSTYTAGANSSTSVNGTIINRGDIEMFGGNGANTYLNLSADTALQGGGTLTLNNGDNNGRPYIQQTVGGVTLTNTNNTIQGAGTLGNGGLTFVNSPAGAVNANLTDQTMVLNGAGGVTNTGLLEATNGGVLQLSTVVNNANGVITGNTGTVNVNSTIQGGTLNGSKLQTLNNATLDGDTSGAITLSSGSTYTGGRGTNTSLVGTINNQGTVVFNGGDGANTGINLIGNTTLQGGGTVTLTNGDANGNPFVQQLTGGLTLTNVNNTIQGAGIIGNGGLALVNSPQGIVNANVSGHVLVLNGSTGVTNTGLLEATNGGTLQVSTVINNANGNITGNTGTVNVSSTIQGGTLNGAQLQTGGNATLDGATQGALTLSSGSTYTGGRGTTTNLAGTINNQGNLVFNGGDGANTAVNVISDVTLQGGGTVTLTNGDGNGNTVFQQPTGGITLTNVNNTIQGAGIIGNGGLSVTNQAGGTILANAANRSLVLNGSGPLTNNGTFQANAGSTLAVQSENFTNYNAGTLTGGTYIVNGAAGNTATMQFNAFGNHPEGEVVNNAATIVLNGPTANTLFVDAGGHDALAPLAHNLAAGSFTVEGGYHFAPTGDLDNAGSVHVSGTGSAITVAPANTYTQSAGVTLVDSGGALTAGTIHVAGGAIQLAGGTLGASSFTNDSAGLVIGNGTINARPSNQGTIEANGGTLIVSNGISGSTGTVKIDSGATLNLSAGASSTAGTLTQNGALVLGSNNVTVSDSYTNANFGTGNSFNNHAGVTGSGQILASGNTAQTITGATVTGGTTATPQLGGFGNLRVGDSATVTYSVANTGTTGPALIGAIQTNVNGGNITDSRLSGSGVTAGNYGPLASGDSQNYSVTFTGTTAGALAAGQAIHVANNFDNVPSQTISLGAGAVYQAAQASITPASPINLGNVHVGGTLGTNLAITNVAPNTGGFTEVLGGAVTGTTGAAVASGSFNGVTQGSTSNAINVGLNTNTAGALSGSATVAFTSSAINNSGLGTIGVGSQTVNVTGAAYRLADANLGSINFGNVLLNSTQSQYLSVTNGAIADGYSEGLNAILGSFSGTGANLLSGSGAVTNLAAGLSNVAGLLVTLNTSSTGSVTANVQVLLASNGAGTSGLGLTALPSQTVSIAGQITGNVGTLASASAVTPNPVNLGNARVGDVAPSQSLTISNTASGPSEGLNASVSTSTSGLTATGAVTSLAAGATNNSSLVVGMNTSTAGSRNGTVTVATASDGTFNNGTVTTLGSQTVNVTGAVYQAAAATIAPTTPINLGNTRVGGTLDQNLTVTNSAANTGGYTETLGGAVTGTTGAATASGSFNGVAQGASSNAINVGLNTSVAGAVSGSATVAFTSSAINNSGLGTIGVGSQTVAVTGAVYQAAQANTLPTTVNLGVVRTGTVVNTGLGIANVAPGTGGYTETLGASFGAVSAGLTGNGAITGLAANAGSSNAMSVTFTAGAQGNVNGSAAVNFVSQAINNSGLGTLALSSQVVNFSATVNALASLGLSNTGGAAFTSTGANSGVLNFGNLTLGSGSVLTALSLFNNVSGPADSLLASLDFSLASGLPFSLTSGQTSFNLAAGDGTVLQLTFDTNAATGFYSGNIIITESSHNGFQTDLVLPTYTLTLQGQISNSTGGGGDGGFVPVPEPSTYGAMGAVMLAGIVWGRRRWERKASSAAVS